MKFNYDKLLPVQRAHLKLASPSKCRGRDSALKNTYVPEDCPSEVAEREPFTV